AIADISFNGPGSCPRNHNVAAVDLAPADRTRPGRRHRLTIRSVDPDPRAAGIAAAAAHLGLALTELDTLTIADIVFVEGDLTPSDLDSLHGLLADPLLQTATWDLPTGSGVEVTFLPGVTDTASASVMHGAAQLGVHV